MKTSLVGRWRIVEMEQWDQDYVDMGSPGHITFKKGGTGQLHFGCVEAELDWLFEADAQRVEFTFSGLDEGDEVTGRGWAKAKGTRLTGRIVFHQGDESGFAAAKGELMSSLQRLSLSPDDALAGLFQSLLHHLMTTRLRLPEFANTSNQ